MDHKCLKSHLSQHKTPVTYKHFLKRPLTGLKKNQTKLNQVKSLTHSLNNEYLIQHCSRDFFSNLQAMQTSNICANQFENSSLERWYTSNIFSCRKKKKGKSTTEILTSDMTNLNQPQNPQNNFYELYHRNQGKCANPIHTIFVFSTPSVNTGGKNPKEPPTATHLNPPPSAISLLPNKPEGRGKLKKGKKSTQSE